jgi:tetratricopeptide (TPR) repeat protein
MKQYIILGCVLFLILITIGCGKKEGIKSEKGVLLTGYVFNVETGNPVKNVSVSLQGAKDTVSIKTPTGRYAFDVEPGLYTMVIEKKGFAKGEQKLKFSTKREYSFDYILLKEIPLTPEQKEAQERLQAAMAAFTEGDVLKAKGELNAAMALDPNNKLATEYMEKVDGRIAEIADSLYKEGLSLEGAKKNTDALMTYEKVLSYQPEHADAKARISAINKLLAAKPKPKPKPKPTNGGTKPKPKPVNVNAIYQQGISLFSQGKYKSAIAKFNTVLRHQPGHSGAKTYRAKAQKRLKALGG